MKESKNTISLIDNVINSQLGEVFGTAKQVELI